MRKGWFFILSIVMFFHAELSLAGKDFPRPRRIVVLYAAASPVLKALGMKQEVVGVTRTDHVFPEAVKVGSHLRPNIELIKALKPDLLIVGSRRAFPDELAKRLKISFFRYDPRTLEEILETIERLGKVLGREKAAEKLIFRLKTKLAKVKSLPIKPRVIYEVSSVPLKVVGQKSIVSDIIAKAGGINPIKVPRKHVLISPEKILEIAPEFYFYQVGPMNRNPVPPKKRPYFKGLKAEVVRVSEKEFARPGLNAFEAVLKMNRIFWERLVHTAR